MTQRPGKVHMASVERGKAIMEGYDGPPDGIVGDDDTRDPVESLVRSTAVAALERVLELFLEDHVERRFEAHRLAYVYDDTDTAIAGTVELFVCKCGEAYVRRMFNAHLKKMLKEVA